MTEAPGDASRPDRRQGGQERHSPMETLRQLPALVVLERFPVPVLAIGADGTILFANSAFADMLGLTAEYIVTLRYDDILGTPDADQSAVDIMRAQAGLTVELRHHDASTVHAKLSKSALLRGDDQVALAVFEDLTEQLWLDEV